MPPVTAVLDVRFADCDPMGHVNNANYLTYCEQARVAFLQQHGLGWQLPFILAEATVRFVYPAKFGDRVHVHLSVGHIGTKSWRFDYRLTDPSGERLYAEGSSVQVAYDYAQACSVAISAGFRAALERCLANGAG